MLFQLLALVANALAAPIVSNARCKLKFSSIVAFGDSFTDNGNGAYRITNGTWPPVPPYYKGRFSNGPVWVEDVATNLSIPLHDHAVGGSTTSNKLVQGFTGKGGTVPVPSTDEQVDAFLENPSGVDISSALFVVSGGANDAFYQPNISAYLSQKVLTEQVTKLQEAGAQHFFFFNYYNAALIPFDHYAIVENKDELRNWSTQYGRAIDQLHLKTYGSYFYNLETQLFPHLYYYGEPTTYGFDVYGAYGSCVVGTYRETPTITVCNDPDKHVFWDEYHMSRKTHQLFANGVLETLYGKAVTIA